MDRQYDSDYAFVFIELDIDSRTQMIRCKKKSPEKGADFIKACRSCLNTLP